MRSIVHRDQLAASLADAQVAVAAAVEAARAGVVRGCPTDELSQHLAAVRRLQAQLESVALTVVREVDVQGGHRDEGYLTAGSWLRAKARLSPREAATSLRTARVLASGELDATSAALAAGEIDAAHAHVIAGAAADAPAGAAALIEPEALAAARVAEPRATAEVMRQFRHALEPDDADAAALARYMRRGLTLSPLLEGAFNISGFSDEANGAVIATALDSAGAPVPGDRRTPAQRRLDALAEICNRFLSSGDAPSVGGGHPHVIVTMDAATAAKPPGEKGSPGAMLSWVGRVGASTAQRVACDADVTMVLIDQHGHVREEQRQRRFFTAAQKSAMVARDGDRCAAPFCDRPASWSDGHHLTNWARGGPTTVEHGALPCSGHHLWLHEGHWLLRRLPDGRYVLEHPDGRVVGPEPFPAGRNRPPPRQRE